MRQLIGLLFIVASVSSFAQKTILNDSVYIQELRGYVDDLYDYNFDNSDTVYSNMVELYPEHPFPDLYYALVIYWKYFPVTLESKYEPIFLEKINSSIRKAESYFEQSPNEESIFFNLLGRMLLMQYFADNQTSSNVIPHIKPAYQMLVKGFELEEELSDFKFSSGVYNYYREYYPKAYPIYKPVAYFFPEGNAEKGIKQLETNASQGVFLHKESLSFLVYISMYFEKDYKKTLKYARKLRKENPNNLLYQTYYIQSLLLQRKYHKASQHVRILREAHHENDFFKAVAILYSGVIQEKKYNNSIKAKAFYQDASNRLDKYGDFVATYKAIALYGLSRLETDKRKSSKLRKQAKEIAIFSHINFD